MNSTSWKIILVLVLFGATHAQTPDDISSQTSNSSSVHVKLIFADNKSSFRIGEPVRLIMEFTGNQPGASVEIMEDRKQPTLDRLSITPESGFTRWLNEMRQGSVEGRHVFGQSKLSATERVGFIVNDTLRFDQPGKYTVRLTTTRVSNQGKRLTLTTNELTFDVLPMSSDEERAELKRINALLDDPKRDWQVNVNVFAQLSYLTGDESTREKVRRFVSPDGNHANHFEHLFYGLFIARNRDLVLQLLESAIRDVNQPVTSSTLMVTCGIRFLKENRGSPTKAQGDLFGLYPGEDPKLTQIRSEYISELAVNLGKRSGRSLTTTAMTILTAANRESPEWATTTGEARRVLSENFATLHPFERESLIQTFGDQLREPSMIAHLKKMLSYEGVASDNIHRTALERLIEWAPDEARPYVAKEICNPQSSIDLEIIGKLSDKSLPEIDSCLVEQFKVGAKSSFLEIKAGLMTRFATENIYGDVLRIYSENKSRLSFEVRAGMLAYLAKHNEEEAIPLIEEALNEVPKGREHSFLPKLTKLNYSTGIARIVKRRLEVDEPRTASNAAYLIGLHGVAGDESLLQSRLDRWRTEWASRAAEADKIQQGELERELVYALIHGKAWKLSPERIKLLKEGCVTTFCKRSNP